MNRDRLNALMTWRHASHRKPLLLRGCRQVGKSWLVREFGKQFDTFIEINFERDKSIHTYFSSDLHIDTLLDKLALYAGKKITPGQTLIFFDEVQASEGALASLRYFKEDRPDLHIIAAGSLLDFALNQLGLAVGRFEFMHLYPLSFGEYLSAVGEEAIRAELFKQKPDSVIHERCLSHLKNYMWLGGMPDVVNAWILEKDPMLCQRLQDDIIESYQVDFLRYARQHEIPFVSKVFSSIPAMLGQKFKYTAVDADLRSEGIKNAVQVLETAGIAKRCVHTSAQSQPLSASQNDKKFKVFYFDIGIAQRLLGLDLKQWLLHPIPLLNQGAIAEQLVAQELIAYSDYHKQAKLYYWHREAKNSNAEIDFIVIKQGQVLPLEVKSGHDGRMKSIQLFLESHPNATASVKVSQGDFAMQGSMIELPLYGLEGFLGNV